MISSRSFFKGVAGVAFVLCCAGAAGAATPPTILTMTTAAGGGTCPNTSAAKTTFLPTDSAVWFDVEYNGESAGDAFNIQWVEPNGTVYTTDSYTQAGTGDWCAYYNISVSGYPPAGILGTWTVKFLWNGTQIASTQFTIVPVCTSFAVPSGWSPTYLIDGGSTSVTWSFVTTPSNCGWTASGGTRITAISQTSGAGGAEITANFLANNTTSVVTDTVTLTSGAAFYNLNVDRNPYSCAFTATPPSLTFAAAGGTQSVQISSNLPACYWQWYQPSIPSWLNSTAATMTGTQSVSVTALANTGAQRSVNLATFLAVTNLQVPVTQSPGTDNLSVSPSTVSVSNGSGSGTVSTGSTLYNTGTAATSFTITANTSSGGNWLSGTASSYTIGSGGSVSITAFANTSNLPPGNYSGTLTMKGAFTSSVLTVNLSVSGVSITANPNPISLGTIQPQKQPAVPVTVTSVGGSAVVAISIAPTGSWLSVNTTQITANLVAALNVTVDATSLSPGPYGGAVTLQCTAAPCISISVPVSFTVAGVDNLGTSPSTVSPSNGAGAGQTTVFSSLGNSGNASTAFTLTPATTSGGAWLTATAPIYTIAPGGAVQLKIIADTTHLAPGSYSGTVTVQGTTSKSVVTVNLIVSGVSITANPNPISLGLVKPQKQTSALSITSVGGSTTVNVGTAISAGQGAGWLTVDLAQVAAAAVGTIHVTVDASLLKPGPYQGTVTLQCQPADPCVEVDVPLTFTVLGGSSLVCPPLLTLTDYLGWTAPVTQPFTLGSSDGTAVPLGFSGLPSWLQISPATGNAGTGQTAFTASGLLGSLPLGNTAGTLNIVPTNNTSSCLWQLQAVVNPFTITATPNPLPFTPVAGQTQTLSLSIATTNNQSVNVLAQAVGDSAGAWVKAGVNSLTAPGNLNVVVNAANLTGSHTGSVTLTCDPSTPCPAVTVPVTVQVSTSVQLVLQSQTMTFTAGANNAPPAVQTALITASDNTTAIPFTVVAASTGNWLAATANQLNTPATLSVSIASLPAQSSTGTVTIQPASGTNAVITVSYNAPTSTVSVTQVLSGAGEASIISQYEWVELKGTNLSQVTQDWSTQTTFQQDQLPTSVAGVSATVNNKPAFVEYVSPAQVNILTPLDTATGPVTVTLTTPTGSGTTTVSAPATMAANSLGFFVFNISAPFYPAAIHGVANCPTKYNGACFLGPATLYPGLSTPAAPGETIVLYANGFGQVNPLLINGVAFPPATSLPVLPVITIGGLPAKVDYAAVVAAGEYQFNVEVPLGVPNGDNLLVATYNGFTTQPNVYVTVQK